MEETVLHSEQLWLQQLQQHDEQALALLMQHYYTSLYNYAFRFTRDDGMIRDCVQEVFISLWQRRADATGILSLKFYLLRAVKNQVLKSLHRNKRKPDNVYLQGEYEFFQEFSIEKFIIEKQISEERAALLKQSLSQLSARQHEVIYLKFYQQLDHGQIAELMNISRQSVYNLLHETIQKLRSLWQAELVSH